MANEYAEHTTLRSPLGRVRGLGSAKSGTHHWWLQRVTSVLLLPLTIWFGDLPLRRVLYRADRVAAPACRVPVEPFSPDDGWCDDPGHPDYNRAVRLPHPARHERMWREDPLYDVVGVLGWNDAPVARGRGSAIFLHLARPDFAPTEGCVALAEADLRSALAAGLSGVLVAPGS